MHLRNSAGRTPLFVAAFAQLAEHVSILKQAGAHLNPDELATARLHAQVSPKVWHIAGI